MYIKRESEWSQSAVDEVYGPLILANKLKWTFFSLMLAFGLGFLGLTVFCGLKYHKMSKEFAKS